VKSDEKASLAPRTAGERSPRSLTRNRQGRQTLFVPKNLLAANAKSHRKLQNVRKVRTVLCGGLEHQTRRKPQCSRSIRPRNSHYSEAAEVSAAQSSLTLWLQEAESISGGN
jgi:hypothetical protein